MDASHLRLLLVDDVEQTRSELHELLGGYGFDILKAENGKEALALLATHNVDLVITDQMMPEMDGLALLSAIRAEYPDTLVLLYSASPPLLHRDGSAPDFDSCLLKPASSEDIVATIHRLCHGKRQENQAVEKPL
ncbi:MAG: response regulator [Marinobacterium sp.]